ncbi:MAG: iron-sulfur cluster assembly accessory protein [Chryseotalea sp. WA131a]|jgi:iron-sulfur cluster assembly protein|nr:MAG: iron-sulfur cluster assembly accessory protein [Chryseotalea sp. WA131a]
MFDNIQPITLTARAAEEVQNIMHTKNIPEGYALRLGIKGGGCGGVSLIIGFDKQKPNDLHYVASGVPVLVDKKHTMYLIGKQVDFYEGADAKGFMFVEAA